MCTRLYICANEMEPGCDSLALTAIKKVPVVYLNNPRCVFFLLNGFYISVGTGLATIHFPVPTPATYRQAPRMPWRGFRPDGGPAVRELLWLVIGRRVDLPRYPLSRAFLPPTPYHYIHTYYILYLTSGRLTLHWCQKWETLCSTKNVLQHPVTFDFSMQLCHFVDAYLRKWKGKHDMIIQDFHNVQKFQCHFYL